MKNVMFVCCSKYGLCCLNLECLCPFMEPFSVSVAELKEAERFLAEAEAAVGGFCVLRKIFCLLSIHALVSFDFFLMNFSTSVDKLSQMFTSRMYLHS